MDVLTNFFNNLGTPAKTLIIAILSLVALFFAARPMINAMNDFSDKKWVPGLLWLAAVIVIVAIPVLFAVFVVFGLSVGNDVGSLLQ